MFMDGLAEEPGWPGRRPALVGREAELEVLVGLLRARRPVAVVGEAGIGKTTLVRAAAAATGGTLHEGGGFATLSWLPYLALRRATRLIDTGDPAQVAAAVERGVGDDLLFVDDLQWTDEETRRVLGLLIGRVALVVAIREGDERATETLRPLVASGVAVVRLAGLPDDAAIAIATRLRPGLPTGDLRRLAGLAGGNPLLIEELALHGQASSSLSRAIVGHLSVLSAMEREALELLTLAGSSLRARAVGPAAGRLLERGLVRAVGDRLVVRHPLVAEALAERLDGDRRRDLHDRLGRIVDEPVDRARHLASAGRTTAAFEVARAALESAVDPRARARLLEIAAETTVAGEAAAYRLDAASAFAALGDSAHAVALLEPPIDGDDATRAAAAAVLAGALHAEGRHDAARAAIDGARELQPPAGRPELLALAIAEATLLLHDRRHAEAIELLERARTTGARTTGAHAGAVDRIDWQLAALRVRAGQAGHLPALEASAVAAMAAGDGGTAAGLATDLYAATLALHGGPAAAALALDWAGRLAGLGYHGRATELRAEAAQAAMFAGELPNAAVRAEALLEEPLPARARARLAASRGLALALLGQVEAAERTLAAAAEGATTVDGRGPVLRAWAEACLWGGQPGRAQLMAAASLGLRADGEWELVLTSLTAAWAEVELGREPCPVVTDARSPFAAGALPELRGLVARARGQHGVAAVEFDEAASRWSGFHAPRELVCRWAAGDAIQRAGDHHAAIERLRAVEARAEAIGFEPLAARARRSMRLAGQHTGRRGSSSGPRGLLTRREREVLALVERGLTNAEIARRMSLGRPTVARLLSNAMLKLGAESRAHAVVLAAGDSG